METEKAESNERFCLVVLLPIQLLAAPPNVLKTETKPHHYIITINIKICAINGGITGTFKAILRINRPLFVDGVGNTTNKLVGKYVIVTV